MSREEYKKKWREVNSDYLSQYEKERRRTPQRQEQIRRYRRKRRDMTVLVRKASMVSGTDMGSFLKFCVDEGLLWTSENIYGEVIYHLSSKGKEFTKFADIPIEMS